jgi:hypothetical protein
MAPIDRALASQHGHFLIWTRIQVNWSMDLRSRSKMKTSIVAPRSWRREWPTTFPRFCPQVLGAKADANFPIATSGAKLHGCAANSGGSNVCANSVGDSNPVVQDTNGNESPGESIGLLRKRQGGLWPFGRAECAAQRASRIGNPNRERWRDFRKCQTRVDASRFVERVGARIPSNRGSLWRFESRFYCRLKNQLPLSRRLQGAWTSMAADLRHVAECSQCVRSIAVGFLGPSEPTELLPLLQPTLRRYRAVVYANSLRDPGARARNLRATSVSTREGTERAPFFFAYSSSNRAAPPWGLGVGLSSGG